MPDWLPALVTLPNDGENDWDYFLKVVYSCFRDDFVNSKPAYRGRRLGLKRYPERDGKEATFWHFTTKGEREEDREYDESRCERIRWPRPIIDNSLSGDLKVWKERRNGGEYRIHLYFEEKRYLVVLADRKNYILPWTAFPIERHHYHRKLLRRWERGEVAE